MSPRQCTTINTLFHTSIIVVYIVRILETETIIFRTSKADIYSEDNVT